MMHNREIIAKIYSPGFWFMFPKPFLKIMKANEAILLAYLINHADRIGAENKSGGWFTCTMWRLMAEMNITKQQQTALIGRLKQKDFIETKPKGVPPKRYIRILYENIQEGIDSTAELEARS